MIPSLEPRLTLVGWRLQSCRNAPEVWHVDRWWHLALSSLISVWPCCTPGPRSIPAHASDGGYVGRRKANGQLEKTAGPLSERLAQQGPGGCRRYTAVYAVEIWDRQRPCSRGQKSFVFSVLTLLAGQREGRPPCKNWIIGALMMAIWLGLCAS